MNIFRVYFVTLDLPNHLDITAEDLAAARNYLRRRIAASMGKRVTDEQMDLLIEQIVNLTEEELAHV